MQLKVFLLLFSKQVEITREPREREGEEPGGWLHTSMFWPEIERSVNPCPTMMMTYIHHHGNMNQKQDEGGDQWWKVTNTFTKQLLWYLLYIYIYWHVQVHIWGTFTQLLTGSKCCIFYRLHVFDNISYFAGLND